VRTCSCVCARSHAERLVEEMRSGVTYDTHPAELDSKQVVRLHELLHAARFPDPKVCVCMCLCEHACACVCVCVCARTCGCGGMGVLVHVCAHESVCVLELTGSSDPAFF